MIFGLESNNNYEYLLCVPGIGLCALQKLFHLIFKTALWGQHIIITIIMLMVQEEETERTSTMSNVTQLLSGRIRILIHAVWLQGHSSQALSSMKNMEMYTRMDIGLKCGLWWPLSG